MKQKYFYIITFDGQIFEIAYTEEKINSSIDSWHNGGLLILKELGGGIHANSIAKILNEELYDSYTFNVKPKLFIKNGIWYDGQERKIVRIEKWKEDQIKNTAKIEEKTETVSDEEKAAVEKIREELREKFSLKN